MNVETLIPAIRETVGVTSPRRQSRSLLREFQFDYWLAIPALLLLLLGLIMVGSASVSIAERQLSEPFYYFWRQSAYVVVGLLLAFAVIRVPVSCWQKFGPGLLVLGMFSLVLVLLVGNEVNGSTRWLSLGVFNLQPSEMMKLFVVIFLAGYMVNHAEEVRTSMKGFMKPLLLVMVIGILLLLEPDFGTAVVIGLSCLAMLFVGGVRWKQFGFLFLSMAVALGMLAYSSPYRVARLTSFLNPWEDPFNSGFQLTQALIAFGRGEWFGVGLGGSIQKLFYLPEAHTDFLFAVLAEELGLFGGLVVIVLFTIIVFRALSVGKAALHTGQHFAAYLCFGLAMLIGLQAYINIGVNMGLLPTKGLTLPLMSYGGSSIVSTCILMALLLRCSHEVKPDEIASKYQNYSATKRKRKSSKRASAGGKNKKAGAT